jgi:hypothetical protein
MTWGDNQQHGKSTNNMGQQPMMWGDDQQLGVMTNDMVQQPMT